MHKTLNKSKCFTKKVNKVNSVILEKNRNKSDKKRESNRVYKPRGENNELSDNFDAINDDKEIQNSCVDGKHLILLF